VKNTGVFSNSKFSIILCVPKFSSNSILKSKFKRFLAKAFETTIIFGCDFQLFFSKVAIVFSQILFRFDDYLFSVHFFDLFLLNIISPNVTMVHSFFLKGLENF
jgi:hypothetical protein